MNWKKFFTAAAAASIAGPLAHYGSEISQGHQLAFTAGNILIPALGTLLTTLTALFTVPPHQEPRP